MLSVRLFCIVMLNVITLSVTILSVIMLNVIILGVIILSVIMLHGVLLSVIMDCHYAEYHFIDSILLSDIWWLKF